MFVTMADGSRKDLEAVWLDENPSIVRFVDQRRLPFEISIYSAFTPEETTEAIKKMVIRGAPSIGVAGAYGIVQIYLEAFHLGLHKDKRKLLDYIERKSQILLSSRPTAVDLQNSINEMLRFVSKSESDTVPTPNEIIQKATTMKEGVLSDCRKISEAGFKLLKDRMSILTHCHTGAFATVDIGTALGPLKLAIQRGLKIHVYVGETRPRLQGSRLTAWELSESNVPYTVIPDSAAASLMSSGKVDIILVGADRICANGDFANKIGTYSLAVLSRFHKLPFFTVAPWSSFDLDIQSGKDIPLEERSTSELVTISGNDGKEIPVTFKNAVAYNPAFDITPHELLTGIVVPGELIEAPYTENIAKSFDRRSR